MIEGRPEIRYARNGSVNLAFSVFGSGPIDLVVVPGFVSHLELAFEQPAAMRFFERLAAFSRIVFFDKRGNGLSDRVAPEEVTDPVDLADDVAAVMDAVGLEKAVLFGVSEGGSMAIRFAAQHPERVSALVTYGCWAKSVSSPDFPLGSSRAEFLTFWERQLDQWGTGEAVKIWAPSRRDDVALREWWARLERQSASRGVVLAIGHADAELDVRRDLETIDVPTLVLHRRDDQLITVGQGRYIAEHVRGARYVELPGGDHLFFVGEVDPMLDAIESFLTGEIRSVAVSREVATLLFADVVDSTGAAVRLGDRRWGEMLDTHDRLARAAVERAGGRVVRYTGDGVLATFATPTAALRAAEEMRGDLAGVGIHVRIGLHAGEIERRGHEVGGLGVHVAARVGALAGAGEILVSRTVVDLVAGSGRRFLPRGSHELRGVPGEWELQAVAPG